MSNAKKLLIDFQVTIQEDQPWLQNEPDDLYNYLLIFSNFMGGNDNFRKHFGGVTIERTDTGSSLGLAYAGRVKLSSKVSFSAWSLLHELAHVLDAKNDWKLSIKLEKYTGGFTNPFLSSLKRWLPGQWDADSANTIKGPGRYGRKPGCNAYGYFYGDKPSGSNWNFNRKEDFAESVVMYCGWERDNALSKTARGRIERYLLPNGAKDPIFGMADNWSDYARYFYPENGDYTKTKRWKFIDNLLASL